MVRMVAVLLQLRELGDGVRVSCIGVQGAVPLLRAALRECGECVSGGRLKIEASGQ